MPTEPTDVVPGWSPWADAPERHWSADPANLSPVAPGALAAGEPHSGGVGPTDQREAREPHAEAAPAGFTPSVLVPARGPFRPVPVRDGATDAAVAGQVSWALADVASKEVIGRDDRRRRITLGVAVIGTVTNGAQVLIGFDRDDVDGGLGWQLDATDPFLVIACRTAIYAKAVAGHDACVVQFISEFDYDDTPLPSDHRRRH